MEKSVYLNEERYQKNRKKLSLVAVIILIVGLCLGGYLIYRGVAKPDSSKIETLQKVLEEKKKDLEDKGVIYDRFANYTDGESYDLKIITEALDPSFSHCSFDEYKNNSITKEYCSAKNSVSVYNTSALIGTGAFICIVTCMISGSIYMTSKGREMLAFRTQQVMPVAKEGIDAMPPTIGNVAKEVAKGVAEGFKEGMEDDENR